MLNMLSMKLNDSKATNNKPSDLENWIRTAALQHSVGEGSGKYLLSLIRPHLDEKRSDQLYLPEIGFFGPVAHCQENVKISRPYRQVHSRHKILQSSQVYEKLKNSQLESTSLCFNLRENLDSNLSFIRNESGSDQEEEKCLRDQENPSDMESKIQHDEYPSTRRSSNKKKSVSFALHDEEPEVSSTTQSLRSLSTSFGITDDSSAPTGVMLSRIHSREPNDLSSQPQQQQPSFSWDPILRAYVSHQLLLETAL